MKNMPPQSAPNARCWTVDFAFRYNDDRQRRVVEELGVMAHEVVRLYCDVCCPGSAVVEPEGTPIRQIICRTRQQARKIVRTFGGRLVSSVPSGLRPPG
jgi:hypothetical protein